MEVYKLQEIKQMNFAIIVFSSARLPDDRRNNEMFFEIQEALMDMNLYDYKVYNGDFTYN